RRRRLPPLFPSGQRARRAPPSFPTRRSSDLGAAVALAEDDPGFMVCKASAGNDAPPIGARLQVGSGFSGECVKSGSVLRCDDAETDTRVDQETCRALGIRSILAVPISRDEKSIGLIETFAPLPNAFTEGDG